MESISLLVTGGTIDKVYHETNGELTFKHTQIKEILAQGRFNSNIDVQELMLVDSLEMSSAQRNEIVLQCKKNTNSKIVITHGTDTMVNTARELAKENIEKTIVLTGAMIPYKINKSDSLFNLGSALAFVQTLPIGVYIAMNGTYFEWNNVMKDTTLGVFKTL